MSWAIRTLIGVSIAVFALAGCGRAAPLQSAPSQSAPNEPGLAEREAAAFVQALKPRRAGTPVVAVLALNERTETTDFLLPHAVLQRAGVAEVHAVAPRGGRVSLYPAFEVEVSEDLAAFDRAHPGGADYVVVPAMEPEDDPAIMAWLRAQAQKGARVIAICRGSRVIGQAGLLDGRRFTGHWSDRERLAKRHPGAVHVPNQRYVIDRDVATSTGISASVPTMLALVEAIGGRAKAQALADELGVASWAPVHESARFALDARRGASYLLNKATAFWGRERWRADVQDGSDDVALALVADAWSRTGRVDVEAAAPAGRVRLKSGLTLLAQAPSTDAPRLPLDPALKPMQQLDRTLCAIADRYGASRHEWVLLEMEYAGGGGPCRRGLS